MKDITLPDEVYRQQIKEWTNWDDLSFKAEPEDRETYAKLVRLGVKKGWPEALEVMGYASYGGNEIFPEDWKMAEYCFKKLIATEQKPSPFYYNSLGYIYYYGRTNDAKPDYQKAYAYYSVAAIHGVYEAMYKVADMLIAGKGVPKNEEAGALLVERVALENRELLERGHYDCKFADAALRLGKLFEDGIGRDKDLETAFSLYLQAEFAIRKRMEAYNFYGDAAVSRNIERAMRRVEQKLPKDYFKEALVSDNPYLAGALLQGSEDGIYVSTAAKDGEVFLLAKLVEPPEGEEMKKQLFAFPELNFADLTDSVAMRVDNLKSLKIETDEGWAFVDHIEMDDKTGYWTFYNGDMPVLRIRAGGFSFEP